jgi:hypothetical protein
MDVFPVHEGSAPLGYVPIYPIWPKHHPMGSPPYPVAHKSGQEPAMEITDVPVMITYSVLRLPARRTDPWTEIPIAGIRAGERKTC